MLALDQDLHLYIQDGYCVFNCLEVVSNINNGASAVYGAILEEMYHRKEFTDMVFRFEHQEANGEAHAWGKASSSLEFSRYVCVAWDSHHFSCIPTMLNFE